MNIYRAKQRRIRRASANLFGWAVAVVLVGAVVAGLLEIGLDIVRKIL